MKNTTVAVNFEQEKLRALQFYAGKKDADIQSELDDCMQKLYEKYVPAQTREYIESLAAPAREAPRRPSQAPSGSGRQPTQGTGE